MLTGVLLENVDEFLKIVRWGEVRPEIGLKCGEAMSVSIDEARKNELPARVYHARVRAQKDICVLLPADKSYSAVYRADCLRPRPGVVHRIRTGVLDEKIKRRHGHTLPGHAETRPDHF